MTQLIPNGKQQFTDINGRPLVGGKVYFFQVGTQTPKDTFQDIAETVLNTNPVILDARGQASIYGTGRYRQVLRDKFNVLIWDQVIADPGGDAQNSVDTLRDDLANKSDPAKGSAIVGFIQAGAGAVGRSALSKMRESVSVLDFMTDAEKAGCIAGTVDVRAAITSAISAVPLYTTILFPGGLRYLISGANGLVVNRSITLKFQPNAWLVFDNNNATYVITSASDVVLDGIQIDGGGTSWVRTGNAGIRVRDDGVSATTGIRIINPYVKNVAGAGILVGWSGEIGDVLIDCPVVSGSGADGVSVTYNTRDVSVISPRCYNTGDDGVSIVSYNSASSPCRRISVTDALSVGSKARGLTIIGGQDIKMAGTSINATAQGGLCLQDSGTYNTYAPLRIELDIKVYSCAGIGYQIGANASDVTGRISVVGARGTRGVLIGSAAGVEPKRVNIDISAADCAGTGIEVNTALFVSLGTINTNHNGLYGLVVGSGARFFSYSSCNAINNNILGTPGVDNIFLSNVVGFSLGATISIDESATPSIERTMDIAGCTNGVIGTFLGVRGTAFAAPNIQNTCVNVVSTGGFGPGLFNSVGTSAAIPTATHYPAGTFVMRTDGTAVYFYNGTIWKTAALT